MTIKALLGMTSNNSNSGSNRTFGWPSSQASALSANVVSKTTKLDVTQADRQVAMYGVLATRNVTGR